ncbi:membrane-bound acyltransferase family [Rhizoctonia solani]|uniref:Membrane-bound acyltransferase family n=1 Tax=Rhizoctonia solani TaxID=456999 RepID=A0A8H7I8A5_9AGAM|nr:membrane-bound acyltransferase family [Rhizoctonia solani]
MVYEPPQNKWKSLGVVSLTVQTPTSSNFTPPETQPPPPSSRWRTPEFLFYGLAFLVVVPYMVKVPYDISNESNPNFYKILPRLKEGWLFGRHIDNSDAQYRSFRSNIPSLLALSTVHLVLGRLYTRINRLVASSPGKSTPGDSSGPSRTPFLLVFSLVMLAGLHGTSALKIIAILAANYWIAMFKIPALTWVFNGAVLFTSNWYEGFRFGSVHGALASLDSIPGFYPRWHISFNITMLRLLSFNMDYYWAAGEVSPTEYMPYTPRSISQGQSLGSTILCGSCVGPNGRMGPIGSVSYRLRNTFSRMLAYARNYLAHDVCGCDQRCACMAWPQPSGVKHGWVLESDSRVDEASYSMALLPIMGAGGWNRSSREHGPMHGKQLFGIRLLEELAP